MMAASLPIYEQIQKDIIEQIISENLKPGDIVYSENELAEKLNVSRLTVRKAYSEMERDGLLYKIKGKGTFITNDMGLLQNLKGGKSNVKTKSIAVMFPELTSFFPKILKGIEEKAVEKGYTINIMFNDALDKEEQAVKKIILGGNVDGVIVTPFRSFGHISISNYQELAENNIPIVMVGKPPKKFECDAVYCDDVQGSYLATKKLLEKGYKSVVHLTNALFDKEAVEERREGYCLAIDEIIGKNEIKIIDMNGSGCEKEIRDIIRNSVDKLAFFLNDDLLAPILYNIIFSEGKRIPEDIAVLGFNDSSVCDNLSVKLSSIQHPQMDIGNIAFELLESRLSRKSYSLLKRNNHVILQTRMIERDST
jgi:GntR family transcriptional regulator, arabinose operon transcriptional repressor